jgi:hypothetical protein
MPNEITQDGSGNFAFQDIHDSNFNIFIGKTAEYKDLLNQWEMQKDLFAFLPEDQIEKRLRASQKIEELNVQIQQFKQSVLQLAAEFDRIEINTDRLRRAKEHFENGEFAAARTVFDSEREQMQDENDRLVEKKERYEKEMLPQLKNSSDEYHSRALLERTAYDKPNWLENTCNYFERSINAQATEDNLFQYALFLKNHNRFDQAEIYYQEFLNEFVGGDISKRAKTLNNLAVLHEAKNELTTAEAEFVEALEIYRKLAAVNPAAYLPYVATTLNNLAVLHAAKNELTTAEAEYVEALEIYRQLAIVNPAAYLSYVAKTLNNLANLHKAKNELVPAKSEYVEALEIYHQLDVVNPVIYLPEMATTLNNLAVLHAAKNELTTAEAEFVEALEIRRKLAAVNPAAYLPHVAMTLNNLAVLHKAKNELVTAEVEYGEALEIYYQLAIVNPAAYLSYVATMLNNLTNLHVAKNELTTAEAEFVEALEIRRKLASVNPAAYLPDVAMTLINIAIYHLYAVPDRELSIKYALEVITILKPMVDDVPYTRENFGKAITVLQQGWGLSEEEIQQMLTEK